jgi:GT2 family glycosyltransferase
MASVGRPTDPPPPTTPALHRHTAFWLGLDTHVPLPTPLPGMGLNEIHVVCSAPRYITLHVAFSDDALPPLVVPLEPSGEHHYRRRLSIAGAVAAAWLEIVPDVAANHILSIVVRPMRWTSFGAIAWQGVVRHARSPRELLAKIRQVLTGGGSFMFGNPDRVGASVDQNYRNWQEAFESEEEHRRIVSASEGLLGQGPIRTLVVVTAWDNGQEALCEALTSLTAAHRAEIHILSLTPLAPSPDLPSNVRACSWQHSSHAASAAMPWDLVVGAIERTGARMVVFIDRPGRFSEYALTCLALALESDRASIAAYGDHDRIDQAGVRHAPVFKPDWSPDYEAACGYVAQPIAFRGDPKTFASMGYSGSILCPSFTLLMHIAQSAAGEAGVHHIPRVLFHERTRPADPGAGERRAAECRSIAKILGCPVETAQVETGRSVVLRKIGRSTGRELPAISVIIPSKDNPEMLDRACQSIFQARSVRADTVIIDNGSTSTAQKAVLSRLVSNPLCKVVADPKPFNFSRLINLGRANARGEILVMLNDDVESLDDGWLHELASQAARPQIGCVGALLLYPDGRVQHAGVVLGINGGAGHAFRFAPGDASGTGFRLQVVHEVSAVTGACLAVRTQVFDAVGGFAEDLPVTLNDIDFCLKVRELGYRNIFTPQARLIHRESTSRGLDDTPERLRRLSRETAIFRRRWGKVALEDLYYSPHLSPGHEDFRMRAL